MAPGVSHPPGKAGTGSIIKVAAGFSRAGRPGPGKQPRLVGYSDRPYGSATQPANRGACLVVLHRECKRPARLQYANIIRMHLLTYSKQARKTLARVPAHVSSRILARMKKIASNPFAPDNNAESMRGMHGYFRLRSGDWRVVYKVETDVLRIVVVKIAPRGGAYE